MNVLMLNASPHPRGCTYTAMHEVGAVLEKNGVDYEIMQVGNAPITDCIACHKCSETSRCIFGADGVNDFIEKSLEADAFVFGGPVYYAHATGRLMTFMDRLFYAAPKEAFAHKPAAAVVSCRRGGTTAALDDIQKYFNIAQMITVGSTYWNMVHGSNPEQVLADAEGIQTMHNIGANMAWVLKCIEAGRASGVPEPENEYGTWTNFHH